MSVQKPLISIVIRAFNEEKHIGKLLTGIERQSLLSKEIVVVDSGSTDGTLEIVKQHGARIVKIDSSEFTFGRSLNRGIEAADGQFIIIISAHCYPVFPDWLEQLLKPFDDPRVAVSYGKQRGAETNHFSEHQYFRTYFPDISQPDQGQPYTHNANAAIRKSLWVEHSYNEEITGLEDLAWSSWAKEQGYSIAYVSEAEIIHIHDETIKQVNNRYRREAVAMKQILPDSRFTVRNLLSMFIRKCLSDLSQANQERVLFKEGWDIIRFRLVQYLGTWQGYRYSGGINQQLHRRFYYPPGSLTEKIPASRSVEPIRYRSTHGEE
ncbi:MAG: glycosyltransferase family 2 protein [Anaerolineales bacterium]|nr:MAG: glycosyltransferase family 2 protein [Anaerolineales bacterium]